MPVTNAKLLIVDDEPANVMLLARIFGRENEVHTADNGHTALALIAEQTFDLVLLDIMMPNINGLEVLTKIRKTYSLSDLPVMLISALNDASDITRGIQIGANDYIGKPFDYDVLQARVSTQIELHRVLRERQQLAEELQIANEVKKRMMQIVSHDLKSPIQNLTFVHSILKEQFIDNPETQELLSLAKLSTDNMLTLIQDFLDIDMMRGTDIPIKLAEVDLFEVLYELYSEYEIYAEKKNIALELDMPDAIIVIADRHRLRQALGNLISNAIKYSPLGTRVYIQCVVEMDVTTIHIIDEGQGIPPAEIGQLFQAFSKISTQPTDGENSTGLGLWSVKQIMEAQSGDVGYQPASTGGADFWLQIPSTTIEHSR